MTPYFDSFYTWLADFLGIGADAVSLVFICCLSALTGAAVVIRVVPLFFGMSKGNQDHWLRLIFDTVRLGLFLMAMLIFVGTCSWLSLMIYKANTTDLEKLVVHKPTDLTDPTMVALAKRVDDLQTALAKAIDERQEQRFLAISTTAVTGLLAFTAFFFTWISVTDYKENTRRLAKELFDKELAEMTNIIAGRIKLGCAIVLARVGWNDDQEYRSVDSRIGDDALKMYRDAIADFTQSPPEKAADFLRSARNNLAFFTSVKGATDPQVCDVGEIDDALSIAEMLEKSSAKDHFQSTIVSVRLAFFDEYAKRIEVTDHHKLLKAIEAFASRHGVTKSKDYIRMSGLVTKLAKKYPSPP